MEQFLTFATRFLLGMVALLAFVELLRYRDRVRLDIALMLVSLGAPVLLAAAGATQFRWVQTLTGMAVVAQPYLLLRLVEDFRPVPRAVMTLGVVGMVLCWVPLMLIGTPLPSSVTLGIIAYFVAFEGYAIVAFVRGAQTTKGVSRWRHGLAAGGSTLLVGAFLLIGLETVFPDLQEELVLARGLFPALTGFAYYLAFVPPAWLRRAWQFPVVRTFLETVAGRPAKDRSALLLNDLCTVASRATGGVASIVFLWDGAQQRYRAASSDVPVLRSAAFTPDEAPVITRVWKEGRSVLVRANGQMGPGSRGMVQAVGASALLAVPVAAGQRSWGVLVVFERRGSLFPSDDLALLEILAEQCAIALDNAELVAEEQRRADEERRLVAQLEVANRELEAFAYSVSHDLRAPLRGIDGFGQALEKEYADRLDDRGLHYLARVRANSRLMGRLIDDLLKLSRVTRSELTMRRVDLSAVASGIADVLQRQEPERKVGFRIQDGVTARGDPGLLQIAMENLLGNAWKFTSKHPSATIEFGVNRDGGTPVYFVKDDGVGFEMEYVDKLFGPFQRLHPEQGFEGTGIGLATVHRIISRHGGRLWAEGAVERGATLYFTIGPER